MNKYEEALEIVMQSCHAWGKEQYKVLKEAVDKANKYEELEQENKVIKEGINTLLNKFSVSKDEINEQDYKCQYIDFRILQTIRESVEDNLVEFGNNPDEWNVDDYNKIKAMLEVLDEK